MEQIVKNQMLDMYQQGDPNVRTQLQHHTENLDKFHPITKQFHEMQQLQHEVHINIDFEQSQKSNASKCGKE
jgi:hypothetical protein